MSKKLRGLKFQCLFYVQRDGGGVRRAVMDGVVGDHGLHTVEARPRVTVGEQEIFGAGGDGHPQAAALLEALGEFCGSDTDGVYGARLQIPGSLKAFPVSVSYTHLDVYKRQPLLHILQGSMLRNRFPFHRGRRISLFLQSLRL